jgi:DegV family protein with EDD domain
MALTIVTDSSCDIRGDEISKYNIKVVPLNVTFGDKNYKEGVDLDIDTFYKMLEESKDFPKTSQPSP